MLRRLVPRGGAASRSAFIARCQCSSSSEGSKPAATAVNKVDVQLLKSYSVIDTLVQTLTSKEGWDQVMDMQNRRIINLLRDPVNSVSVYADLKNPLLTKYSFDAADFLVGSKEAFRQINLGIASVEIFNFANGFVKSSATNELLRQVVSPDIYQAVITAAKGNSAISQAHKAATGVQQTTMTSCTVLDSELRAVNVRVLEEGDVVSKASAPDDDAAAAAASASSTPAPATSAPEAAAATAEADPTLQPPGQAARRFRSATDKHLSSYPLGSVAAIVDVAFTAKEVYATKMATGEDLSHERVSSQVWTFVAEISGKAELDWVATAFRFSERGAFE